MVSVRLEQPQLGDAGEVADVAGKQRQVVLYCGRRNQQIEVGDELAAATEVRADKGEAFHDGVVEWQEGEPGEEAAKTRQLSGGVGGADTAFEEFAVRNDTDGQAFIAQAGQQFNRGGNAAECVD